MISLQKIIPRILKLIIWKMKLSLKLSLKLTLKITQKTLVVLFLLRLMKIKKYLVILLSLMKIKKSLVILLRLIKTKSLRMPLMVKKYQENIIQIIKMMITEDLKTTKISLMSNKRFKDITATINFATDIHKMEKA
jgi:hypothetical protein